MRKLVDDIVTVSEDEILAAVALLARGSRLVAEPSGAVTTAAYLNRAAELPAGRTVAVVSGGNIDPALLARVLSG
jgi:threonine dehydratase